MCTWIEHASIFWFGKKKRIKIIIYSHLSSWAVNWIVRKSFGIQINTNSILNSRLIWMESTIESSEFDSRGKNWINFCCMMPREWAMAEWTKMTVTNITIHSKTYISSTVIGHIGNYYLLLNIECIFPTIRCNNIRFL